MAETIREFLVSLGYRVDSSSEDKFKRSVETATKAVTAMALSLVAATAAVSAAITKIASNFDDLYWTSQRTKASAENIKALGYAVSQLGGSYQGAVHSIEEFARRMRSNPGYEAMARNLGVVTRENGKLRDTTAIMSDLAKVLSRKPQYVALQYLEALGIDENTYNALKSGDLVRYTEEYRKKQEALGVDQRRAAEIGKDLTNAWRALGATAQTVGEKLMQELGPGLKDFVERVDAFLMRNSDRIVEFFKKAAELVGKLMDAFVQLVEKGDGPIVAMFDKIMKSVDSLEKVLIAFAAFLVGSWVVSILGAFTRVGAGWAAMLLRFGINPATLMAGGALALSTSPANGGEDAEIARRRAEGTWGKTPNDGTPGAPPQITDKRNWWQRTMPRAVGGRDAPEAGVGAASLSRRSAGHGARNNRLTKEQAAEMAAGIQETAKELGVSPDDIATAISYETGGTMDPWKKGPTTKWGQHRGLIQWGEPQRRKYGVDESTSIADQMKAVTRYLRDAGVRPGHGLLDIYSAINAGRVGRYGASDAAAGGAPGTVADKVASMGRHKGALSRLEMQGGTRAPAPTVGSAASTGNDAADYARATGGRDLAKDLATNPYIREWAEQMIGRKLAEAPKGDGAPSLPPLARINPTTVTNVQANAALMGGSTGSGAAPLTPGSTTNTTTITMSPKTEVTILGGSDPQATASAVSDAQNGVNGRLLRNMQGATR